MTDEAREGVSLGGDEQPDFLLAANVCFDSKQTLPAGR